MARGNVLALMALVAACGDEPPPIPEPTEFAAAEATEPQEQAPQGDSVIVRETFAYEGAGRDPFQSLLRSGEIRPLLGDLKLVTILFDATYPARSVAVLRDTTDGRRYRLRTGDVLGRARVAQIRRREVVFSVQDFGNIRQEILAIRRREDSE